MNTFWNRNNSIMNLSLAPPCVCFPHKQERGSVQVSTAAAASRWDRQDLAAVTRLEERQTRLRWELPGLGRYRSTSRGSLALPAGTSHWHYLWAFTGQITWGAAPRYFNRRGDVSSQRGGSAALCRWSGLALCTCGERNPRGRKE